MRRDTGPDAGAPWGTPPEFEQAVRETAYFLWESDGRPAGREEECWFKALERCLRDRNYGRMIQEQAPPA